MIKEGKRKLGIANEKREMRKKCRLLKQFKNASKGRIVVALTGQVASGKTTAMEHFRKLGAGVISSDNMAREALNSKKCYNKIVGRFGKKILLKNNSIDRYKLSQIIFRRPAERKRLENLLHPEILQKILSIIKKSDKKILIVDIPLLFETGLAGCFDVTLCVDADLKRRLSRASERGWSVRNFMSRVKSQFSSAEKARLADIVIGNNSCAANLCRQVESIYSALKVMIK
ncbi:MAG: dephospho-CoA kinase [Elusimicrobia bacterium]|nr:dephospho-CoA kinase [Elusimicrobiota bacterium]